MEIVKTTLDIPDDLFRETKAKAAMEGYKLEGFVTEALRLRLSQAPKGKRKLLKFPLIKSPGKKLLIIPDDIAARLEMAEDLKRYKASLR